MDDAMYEILQFSPFDDCQHTVLLTRHCSRVVVQRVRRMFAEFEALHYQPNKWLSYQLSNNPSFQQYRRFLHWRRTTAASLLEREFQLALDKLYSQDRREFWDLGKLHSGENGGMLSQFYRRLRKEKFEQREAELIKKHGEGWLRQIQWRGGISKQLVDEVGKHRERIHHFEYSEVDRIGELMTIGLSESRDRGEKQAWFMFGPAKTVKEKSDMQMRSYAEAVKRPASGRKAAPESKITERLQMCWRARCGIVGSILAVMLAVVFALTGMLLID